MDQIWTTFLQACYWWLTLQILGLSIFRLKISRYLTHVIISTLLLSQITIVLLTFKIIYLLSVLQPIGYFLCVFLIYRFKLWHSFLLVSITYVTNVILELSFNLAIANFDHGKFVEITRNDYIIQIYFLCSVNLVLSFILNKLRIGFSFITSRSHSSKSAKFPTKFYLVLVLGSLLLYFSGVSFIFYNKIILIIHSMLFLVFLYLIHMSYEKELED
ncbi:hypothetical protein GGC63_000569 [Paenibacillus sp. OAS669]|nr:hypothetical protein [Paenibacillus sp. OAS669]